MIIRTDIEQNTSEWIQAKLGRFSASSASDLLMEPATEGYKKLIKRIVEERITGKESENKWQGNKYTDRGHELESDAIMFYEFSTFNKVHRVGLVELDDWVCCSPDGFIGDDGMIQVKCPIFSTQLDYLESQEVPSDYYKQMQFELMVCERKYNIFRSYHPNLPAVTIRVERDEEMIETIKQKLNFAISEVKEKIEEINSRNIASRATA